jgi:hypothetical protein
LHMIDNKWNTNVCHAIPEFWHLTCVNLLIYIQCTTHLSQGSVNGLVTSVFTTKLWQICHNFTTNSQSVYQQHKSNDKYSANWIYHKCVPTYQYTNHVGHIIWWTYNYSRICVTLLICHSFTTCLPLLYHWLEST